MATKKEIEEKLVLLESRVKAVPSFDPKKHKDETRAKIALFVVRFYFWLIGVLLVLAPVYNYFAPATLTLDVKDLLAVLSGVISGPFGFVVGYYFKGSEE